jgi:hypothetical protein
VDLVIAFFDLLLISQLKSPNLKQNSLMEIKFN